MTTSPSLTITALVTPLDQDGNVDFVAFHKLVKHQLDNEITHLLLLGSTGEAHLLEENEKQALIEAAMKIEGVHWWLGCLETSLKKAKGWINQTAHLPIEGYVILAPYYIKPSQTDIEHYFKELLDASSHPCILYNNPSRCAVNVSEEVLSRLFSHPRFLGLKECDLNPLRIFRLRQRMRPGHFLLVGDDSSLPSSMSAGACGVISVLSNAFPKLALDVVHAFQASSSSAQEALKIAQEWLEGCSLIENLGNPKGIKLILHLLLGMNNNLKSPLGAIELSQISYLKQIQFFLKRHPIKREIYETTKPSFPRPRSQLSLPSNKS